MMVVMFLCLSTLLHPAFGKECCKTKSVGSVEYVLADTQEDTAPYGCVDNCVFHRKADGLSSKNYCFKSGDLPVHCHGKTGGSTNAAAGVCLLNTDCDKCGTNVNTINGVRYCCASGCDSPTTIINGECECGGGGHDGATGGHGSSTEGMGGHGGATGGGSTKTDEAVEICATGKDCDKCKGISTNVFNGVTTCCAKGCTSHTLTDANGVCTCPT